MNKTILPPNATPLESSLSEVLRLAVSQPVFLEELIDPNRCPVELLPYLAWSFSVDKWDERWHEEQKRKNIYNAFLIHRQKGTIAALKKVIEPIGELVEIKEWFS